MYYTTSQWRAAKRRTKRRAMLLGLWKGIKKHDCRLKEIIKRKVEKT